MQADTILTYGKYMQQISDAVPESEFGGRFLRDIIERLFFTMRAGEGCGLAAPQIGIFHRIAVVEHETFRLAMVNPVIVFQSGRVTGKEGCLSIPGKTASRTIRPTAIVPRAQKIEVQFQDVD